MARRVCEQANAECKYYEMQPPPELRATQEHGCYSDADHLISQRLAHDALSRYIIQRPENKVQTCRAEHDEKNHRESVTGVDDNPLPDTEAQVQTVLNDIEAGRQVSRSVRKQLRKEQVQVAERRNSLINNFWQQAEERRT